MIDPRSPKIIQVAYDRFGNTQGALDTDGAIWAYDAHHKRKWKRMEGPYEERARHELQAQADRMQVEIEPLGNTPWEVL